MKQRPDGRWQKAKNINGVRVYFYSNEKTEKRAIKDIEDQMLKFTEKKEKGRTFKEVADEWWGKTCDLISPTTYNSYRKAYKTALTEFGSLPIAELTAQMIYKYLESLAALNYSQSTVGNHRLIVNRICKTALLAGDIANNPCASVPLPKGLTRQKRSAAQKYEEDIIRNNHDDFLFPFIALMTGMRRGEILALKWKDIDFEKDLIFVSRSIVFSGRVAYEKGTKTEAGIREIPLLAPLKEVLLKLPHKEPNGFILSDDGGKSHLTERAFSCRMEKYKKTHGITCTAHMLRHSYATIAIECGVPPKTVQTLLGHKQLSTTLDIYTDCRRDLINDAAKILNSKMS